MARAKDEIREQRITMEAVVDAWGSGERAMGWYYYLGGKMNVPFKARCRFARPISVLKVKDEVEVLDVAPAEECESEMFVWVGRAGERIAVPLAQLQPLSKDRETQEPSVIGSTGWIAVTSYEPPQISTCGSDLSGRCSLCAIARSSM